MEKHKENTKIEFIKSIDNKIGVEKLTNELKKNLLENKKVLWFLTGGSNSQTCVDVYKNLISTEVNLENLTVTLTDERYDDVGHKESNWKKLGDLGFDFNKVKNIPVLIGSDVANTSVEFKNKLEKSLQENEVIIGTFGVGSDVHIAGILPGSVDENKKDDLVVAYKGNDFERITIGFSAIKKMNEAFVFIFGDNKKEAVENIKNGKRNIYEEPAQILHQIPEVKIFTDQ